MLSEARDERRVEDFMATCELFDRCCDMRLEHRYERIASVCDNTTRNANKG